jgi:hypothetical protein
MGKIVYGVGISLDGYIARLDGSVDFFVYPVGLLDGGFLQARRYGIDGAQDP